MFRGYVVVYPVQSTLNERPKALNRVCVNLAAHPLFAFMINGLVSRVKVVNAPCFSSLVSETATGITLTRGNVADECPWRF